MNLNDWLAAELGRRFPGGVPDITITPLPSPDPATSDEVRIRVSTTPQPMTTADYDRSREEWLRLYGPDAEQPLTVRKMSVHWPVSVHLAADAGLTSDVPPEPVIHVPWLRRIRWNVSHAIRSARLRLGARIAGVHPEEWQ